MSDVSAAFRLARAGWIMVREGVVAAMPGDQLSGLPKLGWRVARLFTKRRALRKGRSDRLAAAIARLGPSYVKLGQFLATRPDVVGNDIALDLALLQDRMETFPMADSVVAIEGSLGRPVGELFLSFGEPVAAASIAQVHAAEVDRDGVPTKVAVKVIRPGVRRAFQHDLDSYFLAARLQERYIPATRRLRPVEVTKTLAQTTKIEMDLRLEAAALSELGENTREDPGFRVPAVDWVRTGRDVLTLEWIDGIKMSDVQALEAAGHDLKAIAANLVQSFLRHTLRDGFFHADMHPGNLFVEPDGTIAGVDFGITGRLGKKERRFLAEILYGFITRDYHRVAEVHFEAGYVPRTHNVDAFAQAIRAIGEPIHGQPAETISMARLLTLAVRGHRPLRHADPHRAGAACRRPWSWSRAWRARSTRISTCGRRRSPSSATGSARISGRAAFWRTRARASTRWSRSPARRLSLPTAPSACRARSTRWPSMACASTRTTAQAHRQGRSARHTLGPRGAVGDRAGAVVDCMDSLPDSAAIDSIASQ